MKSSQGSPKSESVFKALMSFNLNSLKLQMGLGLGLVMGILGLSLLAYADDGDKKKPPTQNKEPPSPQKYFEDEILPLLDDYCLGCHSTRRKKAGLDLERFKKASDIVRNRKEWSKVVHALRIREMPPENKDQPTEDERIQLADWIESQLDTLDCKGKPKPGRVTARRLNRNEYDNTVRDLLGVKLKPSKNFPSDNVGYGFDNIGDVLSLPPLLLEKYLDAAEAVLSEALKQQEKFFFRTRLQAEKMKVEKKTGSDFLENQFLSINREGRAYQQLEFPESGTYIFRARAFGQQAGPEKTKLGFLLNQKEFHRVVVPVDDRNPTVYETKLKVKKGKHEVAVAYLNNYVVSNSPDPELNGDRNLIVDWLEVELIRDNSNSTQQERDLRLIHTFPAAQKDEKSALKKNLAPFLRRAFRREISNYELDRHLELTLQALESGETFETSLSMGFQAALISPHFLFRLEESDREVPEGKSEIVSVEPYDLASRLSYFLWSSMPDKELLDLAKSGKLLEEKILRKQVQRMLADRRSSSFVQQFAGQWLQMRNLEVVSPDPEMFPDFNDQLKGAMEQETLRYFEAILRENRSILDLLSSNFTYLNERLAQHYGIEGVEGENFRKVDLTGQARGGGILTQASVLTITSNPRRTSPVKRGKWILEQVLGTPPPPPPPNVEELSEEPEAILSGSLRERMEKHREDPTCASCHQEMDTIGFAFENYDPVGKWRDFDGEFLIDPSGTMPDGKNFDGAETLKKLLLSRREQFSRNFSEQLLTYALGRGLEYYDKCAIDRLIEVLNTEDHKIGSLIEAVVLSDPFRLKVLGKID